MVTKAQVIAGRDFHREGAVNRLGVCQTFRAKGAAKTWVRSPERFLRKVHYGILARDWYEINQDNAAAWFIPAACPHCLAVAAAAAAQPLVLPAPGSKRLARLAASASPVPPPAPVRTGTAGSSYSTVTVVTHHLRGRAAPRVALASLAVTRDVLSPDFTRCGQCGESMDYAYEEDVCPACLVGIAAAAVRVEMIGAQGTVVYTMALDWSNAYCTHDQEES